MNDVLLTWPVNTKDVLIAPNLCSVRFLAKHADAELLLLLAEGAPPPDLSRIGIFRAAAAKHAKKVGQAKVVLAAL